ncbi:MAG TPA: 4Fe-4S dicluster domain-containing protein [Solirubrobacteraceae bacterium]|nr:4Fe-4S dicluster domain-containing protein [Solirubrobacteraceae bacterium]
MAQAQKDTAAVIAPEMLDELITVLRGRGFRVLGPRVRDGAIVYDDLSSAAQLPIGWTDEQDGGSYRLRRRSDQARFGYAVGPHSWKQFLFRPEVRLWRARRSAAGDAVVEEEPVSDEALAFIGVRSCELHAIEIQDRVFMGGAHVDRDYAAQRAGAFLVAVNCTTPAGTCFCVSMGTGPKAGAGFDLALTELLDGEHRLLAEAGSERGAAVLAQLPRRPATEADLAAAGAAIETASSRMGRTMETGDLRDLLAANLEHPRWDDVADRCLSCGNCTQVCPTCFCSSVEDASDLGGEVATRTRVWDTCFSVDYSHIHGGAIRRSSRSRYRQWMTHKLGTWIDQFGTSGCVGCGRCITWCPVGIDITAEVAAIRATEQRDAAA